ncbi:pilus assembly PilX family protein [Vreelandella sulfidaeris]|uniref:pilus assembly PilX family protein n=1 Tax=Vreelandella sulfidaeris TaxID=115553 RepID=UPI0035EDD269
MKQQQGAALVIVMALLSGALMLGMSGMQSALIDERLAGNYRASVQSQMGGEGFLAATISDENKDNLTEFLKSSLADLDDGESKTLSEDELIALSGNSLSEADSNLIVNVSRSGDQITLEAWGAQAGAKAPTVITFNASGTAQNFRSPFLACRQMLLNGSSLAASCRSNDTVCSQDPAGFISADSQTYNLLYNLGSEQGDSITLDGDADAYGNVRSQRDIMLTGSSAITGNAYAQGVIFQPSGTRIVGNAANITGTPQRCDVFFDSSALAQHTATLKQQYGKSVGNIAMGDYPRRQWALTPEGLFYYDEKPRTSGSPVFDQCGFLDLRCIINFFLNFFWNLLGFDICNNKYVTCDSSQNGWTKHSQVINNAIVVDDLILASNSTFIVSGVESDSQAKPAQLRMVVEGAFSVSGGGNGLIIEDNAWLELFVKGKTTLASNLQMGSGSATRNGQAPLTINSSYAGVEDAVTLSGGSHLVGNIYAPSAGVTLMGSRVSGSVWANKINAIGSSHLIFNEINSVADGQYIETESSSGTATGFKPRWQ